MRRLFKILPQQAQGGCSELLTNRRGTAAIEFALLSAFFFLPLTAALDIGVWYQQRLRLDSAVEQGAMIAFGSRTNVDQAAIGTFVAAAAKLTTTPTVTIGCNGGTSNCVNSGRTYACVSAGTPNPTFTAATHLNDACADGSLAGYYMTIDVSAASQTMVVSSSVLGGITQKRRAVVRLE
jgi:Flp pilus assembly protein TadG